MLITSSVGHRRHSDLVHRAAANEIDFINRTTRGSVRNGLLSALLVISLRDKHVFFYVPRLSNGFDQLIAGYQ